MGAIQTVKSLRNSDSRLQEDPPVKSWNRESWRQGIKDGVLGNLTWSPGISSATRETYGWGTAANQVMGLRCGEWKNLSFTRTPWGQWSARHQHSGVTTGAINVSAFLISSFQLPPWLLSHRMLSMGRAEETAYDHRAKWCTMRHVTKGQRLREITLPVKKTPVIKGRSLQGWSEVGFW